HQLVVSLLQFLPHVSQTVLLLENALKMYNCIIIKLIMNICGDSREAGTIAFRSHNGIDSRDIPWRGNDGSSPILRHRLFPRSPSLVQFRALPPALSSLLLAPERPRSLKGIIVVRVRALQAIERGEIQLVHLRALMVISGLPSDGLVWNLDVLL
ncbi:hypothetical protein PENTCL1PPCAC_4301, partial [Pristionchus entomophagus]